MFELNLWLWTAAALLVTMVPPLIVCITGTAVQRFIALQMCQGIAALVVILFSRGYDRSIYMDVALALALVGLGSGLVYARFLERWT